MTFRMIPPLWLLLAMLGMLAADKFFPNPEIVPPVASVFGAALILGGMVLAASGARLFVRAGTPVRPFEEASTLVTDGPYRFTRNPMYLGMVCVLCGEALILRSLWPWLAVPIFVWVITTRFIRNEEALLARKFPTEFAAYKNSVRRWL